MEGEGILKTLSLKAFKTLANLYRKTVKGSRPLEDGELHFLAGNFIGPGTKIEKYRNVKPLNRPDAVAKQHDIDYYEAEQKFKKGEITNKERKELIRLADNKMIRALKEMGKLEGIEERYRQAGLKGIQFKRKVENVSPSLAKQLLPADLVGKKRKQKSLLGKGNKSEVGDATPQKGKGDKLSDMKVPLLSTEEKDETSLEGQRDKMKNVYLPKLIELKNKRKKLKKDLNDDKKVNEIVKHMYLAITDKIPSFYKVIAKQTGLQLTNKNINKIRNEIYKYDLKFMGNFYIKLINEKIQKGGVDTPPIPDEEEEDLDLDYTSDEELRTPVVSPFRPQTNANRFLNIMDTGSDSDSDELINQFSNLNINFTNNVKKTVTKKELKRGEVIRPRLINRNQPQEEEKKTRIRQRTDNSDNSDTRKRKKQRGNGARSLIGGSVKNRIISNRRRFEY